MRILRTIVALWLALLVLLALPAAATNDTLWINGRTGGGIVGNYDSFNYWGPASTPAGINKKSANWNGRSSTARAMYNHNATRGIWFYMYAGARGTLYSSILPGQDDEVEAYHGAGGVSGNSGHSLCNPGDWFCDDLTLGTAQNQGGSTKWAFHSVAFRDDGEDDNHYTGGDWGGIVSVLRAAVVDSAR